MIIFSFLEVLLLFLSLSSKAQTEGFSLKKKLPAVKTAAAAPVAATTMSTTLLLNGLSTIQHHDDDENANAHNDDDDDDDDDGVLLLFPNRLPSSRLGKKHLTLNSFQEIVYNLPTYKVTKTKEFTLVVVTDHGRQRILLGMKNRGFGKGMYNSFGGKVEFNESIDNCACRELEEETGIVVTLEIMQQRKVGIQHYTFDNDPIKMIMHVYKIDIDYDINEQLQQEKIGRQCTEEITPEWFDNYRNIPLDNMFADDSLWLTALLSSSSSSSNITINGHYHFQENCQETNTILHYCMDVQLPYCMDVQNNEDETTTTPKPNNKLNLKQAAISFPLEKRLFHAIHQSQINSPSIKEFKECYAFLNAVKNAFKKKQDFDVVIDVAGGHGALGALFLICTSAYKAVVVDPAPVRESGGVQMAWKEFLNNNINDGNNNNNNNKNNKTQKQLMYRQECLRTGLPAELDDALAITTPDRILVVACHACQNLSQDTLQIVCNTPKYQCHIAVMPCCQKDLTVGQSWKSTSKNLQIPIAKVMDILLAGQMMNNSNEYDVRMKCIDSKITPQNRIIICKRLAEEQQSSQNQNNNNQLSSFQRKENAYKKLEVAYAAAHKITAAATSNNNNNNGWCNNNNSTIVSSINQWTNNNISSICCMAIGFVTGILTAMTFSSSSCNDDNNTKFPAMNPIDRR